MSLKRLNKVMFFIIALGALLPTMHQSSMGSLMISAGYKVHPLWQSYEMLPLFSLLTAFIMGFSIVILGGERFFRWCRRVCVATVRMKRVCSLS